MRRKLEHTYSIYCHTTPSGRKYVGMSCDPEKRWRRGLGYVDNFIFYRAIQKYGWDNIKHEILSSGHTLEEAKEIEKKLIEEWDLRNHEKGYNIREGGSGKLSQETLVKLSKARKGKPLTYKVVITEDQKERISSTLKEYYSTHDHPMKGKHHTEETKEKLRHRTFSEETLAKMRANHASFAGKDNPSARAVVQLSKDGTEFIDRYDYAKLAAQKYSLDLSSLIKCCRGKLKTHGGFRWMYEKDYESA